ncbi:maleylpyruvate isomerase family mycothiol-dependent enzyme [Rhodococcus aerolatus]
MDADAVREQVAGHRRVAADLLDGLSERELATPSLCTGWDVRVLAAHLALPMTLSRTGFLRDLLVARGSVDRAMDRASRRAAQAPPADVVRVLRERADHPFRPPGSPPITPLVEVSLHLRDAARPLGAATGPTPAQWEPVLAHLSSGRAGIFVPRGRLDGLALVATDSDFTAGAGPVVRGPSEALALAAVGRTVALADLDGDGVATLRDRLR